MVAEARMPSAARPAPLDTSTIASRSSLADESYDRANTIPAGSSPPIPAELDSADCNADSAEPHPPTELETVLPAPSRATGST
ncbi:Uncharacterised protein [Mycobacteroides abscessus subsp. abscessus]|nr:Uncharacterised protein [Mycobacteroides abscessus subsp. abscessus]